MSGYGGSPDLESEHALILSENGIAASQMLLMGLVLVNCLDCGIMIPAARREAAKKLGHKCTFCIECQVVYDKPSRIKMLDRIL